MTEKTDPEAHTRAELMDQAREADISGRNSMSKKELAEALDMRAAAAKEGDADTDSDLDPTDEAPVVTPEAKPDTASRVEAFRDLSRARARGEMVFLPRHLTGHERRIHVRQTIREDHETRIARPNSDAREKFAKLHDSVFSFFRGTSLLFYRDLAGEDALMPTVLTLGDVHPENFGVMPSADDVPIFGVNDFDEAFYAPFTWDLKRGAVGFMIAAEAEGGMDADKQRRVAEEFVRGYVDAMRRYATDATEQQGQMRQDNAPKVIRQLIEDKTEEGRDAWLARKYHDEQRRRFRADDEHVPISSRTEEFQALFEQFIADNDIELPDRALSGETGALKVKDVCQRLGQGTASLGLPRYYLLLEGPAADGSDDLIIEFKQARRSALAGLAPPSEYVMDGSAERITHAQGVHLVRGDRFYGAIELDGKSFMVRERAPYRGDIDLDDLSKKEWRKYARTCGASLAQSHALSDEAGLVDHDVEPDVLEAIEPEELFVSDLLAWSEAALARVKADHEHFKADHDLGAFTSVDRVFR
ncbi:DUF2252 domain-containing protein [Nocardioides bruguierae]|uniref:DUF2252 domain-containing protein n=1 Tax=Nocardioides bruguierae TaxID=2945102 RepID=A0A9X2D7V3_9ACTN|nr:DUF2252 family protein [Nocardioides bruguierae]MCM0620776.1 DUF2252 domain-containing protein [Nocardioides bruguierae]